jgi:hypothetical protein
MYEALSGAAAANILAAGGSVKRAAAAAAAAVKAAGGTEEDALFAAKSIGDSIAEHKARAASVQKIAAKTSTSVRGASPSLIVRVDVELVGTTTKEVKLVERELANAVASTIHVKNTDVSITKRTQWEQAVILRMAIRVARKDQDAVQKQASRVVTALEEPRCKTLVLATAKTLKPLGKLADLRLSAPQISDGHRKPAWLTGDERSDNVELPPQMLGAIALGMVIFGLAIGRGMAASEEHKTVAAAKRDGSRVDSPSGYRDGSCDENEDLLMDDELQDLRPPPQPKHHSGGQAKATVHIELVPVNARTGRVVP